MTEYQFDNQGTCSKMQKFLADLSGLVFAMHINDPPLRCGIAGAEVKFDGSVHDIIDGFLKFGELAHEILPRITKLTGECLVKAGVLGIDSKL